MDNHREAYKPNGIDVLRLQMCCDDIMQKITEAGTVVESGRSYVKLEVEIKAILTKYGVLSLGGRDNGGY